MSLITDFLYKPVNTNLVISTEGQVFKQSLSHDYLGTLEDFLQQQQAKLDIFLPLFRNLFYVQEKSSGTTSIVYQLDSLRLNASWCFKEAPVTTASSNTPALPPMVPSGARFEDRDQQGLVTMAPVWTPPKDLKLFFIYGSSEHYLLLANPSLTFCATPPLPNTWKNGRICLGDLTTIASKSIQDVGVLAAVQDYFERLNNTFWGGDLWDTSYATRAQKVFELNPASDTFTATPTFEENPEFWKSNTFPASGDFTSALEKVVAHLYGKAE